MRRGITSGAVNPQLREFGKPVIGSGHRNSHPTSRLSFRAQRGISLCAWGWGRSLGCEFLPNAQGEISFPVLRTGCRFAQGEIPRSARNDSEGLGMT